MQSHNSHLCLNHGCILSSARDKWKWGRLILERNKLLCSLLSITDPSMDVLPGRLNQSSAFEDDIIPVSNNHF